MPIGRDLRQKMCRRLQWLVALQNFEFGNHFILEHVVSEVGKCKSKLLAAAELHHRQSYGYKSDSHLQVSCLVLNFSYNFTSPQSVVFRTATSMSSES